MKRLLLVLTVVAVILTGAWATTQTVPDKKIPSPQERAAFTIAKANEMISQGINLIANVAYEKGYADGYGQARLECFQNGGKLPTQKTQAK